MKANRKEITKDCMKAIRKQRKNERLNEGKQKRKEE